MNMQPQQRNRQTRGEGFTLLEMLVVLMVLGLLVSLAMPTFTAAEAKGQEVVCKNNLKELGLAFHLTQQHIARRGEMDRLTPSFLDPIHWPNRVWAENDLPDSLFMCPEDPSGRGSRQGLGNNILFRIPWNVGGHFIPFDDSHYQCASRRGTDAEGKPYTEYVIEDNPGWHDSRFDHGPCCGHPEFSTNDGIWRVYDEGSEGKRRMILTFFNCNWTNSLYINGDLYSDDLGECLGTTIWFDAPLTSYGYNVGLKDQYGVTPDTVWLLDYSAVEIDPFNDLDVEQNLNTSGRHRGRHNVLYAGGHIGTATSAELYPDMDATQWTPDDD
jgi:prepilin-type N-terminal cleavage/methylation domain-containing protein/prepilin-type processing-associated H-X9-DG protein